MQEILITKLHKYILENNLDVVIALQDKNNVESYLKEKVSSIDALLTQLMIEDVPGYIIEERCMDTLTQDLRPSKFNYLASVLEDEFESEYFRLKENGTLTYEVINLIELCNPVFQTIGFTEDNENDRQLQYAITGVMKEYFEKQ